ncbi:NAD-reducing hydrogenase subunit HoxF [Clostridiaceae bacterium JG1575]|nr:NAD-reducing hydrogenase subunit HoxF [Clostridiaceae bacterium JG1575]
MIMKALNQERLTALRDKARGSLTEKLKKREDVAQRADGSFYLSGPYYERQMRIALANAEIIDPESLAEYIALGGYEALAKVLEEKRSRQEMVDEMIASGLRGRGGAGFSTGRKWAEALKHDAPHKYVICNADEGDPGAYMDRHILEADPHAVLEGMALAGYSIGADHGYIYVRAEYPLAVERLTKAIEQAQKAGLLGENILGSGFSFHIEIRLGAGAFVCGEGTALMESIEGRRGMPRNKEFRTAHKGLFDLPTVINNVETLANVHHIYQKGAAWYAGIGTEKSTGTKVFALVGKVAKPGLVEVPMGTSLRTIIFEIGGGIKDQRAFKAVQTGGPSGGCIPKEQLDTPVDFESLAAIGSIMGSGGLVTMDETDCMVDIARFFTEFTVDESCGKCTPCRIGNRRVLEILEAICEGRAVPKDLVTLLQLCEVIRDTSLCGLGQAAPNPVLSTLHHFRQEYEAHVFDKRCPAGVCKNLLSYQITDRCIGCGICKKKCPVSCISGEPKSKHLIDQTRCIKCGQCYSHCPVNAIVKQ